MGLSKFHTSARTEAGLRLLLDAFGHATCQLTHLDVSGNAMTHEDAALLLGVALRPESVVKELKVTRSSSLLLPGRGAPSPPQHRLLSLVHHWPTTCSPVAIATASPPSPAGAPLACARDPIRR